MITRFKELTYRLYTSYILKKNNVSHKKFFVRGYLFLRNRGKCEFGDNIRLNSKLRSIDSGDTLLRIIVEKNAWLKIGNNVGISTSTIYCANEIIIGNNTLIGGGSRIQDTDFHSLSPEDRHSNDTNIITKPIIIEDSVFIGTRSIILKGVTIGKNSIIGAGSVVTKSIPAGEIWGGAPAKFIRKI